MNWLTVVNKNAGGGSAGKHWDHVRVLLEDAGIVFTVMFTKAPAQTRLIASNALAMGFDGIIVFGGDGTISDAAAAVSKLKNKPVLASLPAGSGNDWLRSLGFNIASFDSCIKAIAQGQTQLVDSGMCIWPDGSRFFLNTAGVGFDALVLRRTITLRKFLPSVIANYLFTMAASALLPPHWRATLFCDGKPFYKGDYLSFTTGVGRYSGGGMQLSPHAIPNDELLDSMVISPMNALSIAMNIPKLFNGDLHKTQWATSVQGTVMRIEPYPAGKLVLELDGEVVIPGKNSSYIELVSKPGDLRVIAPASKEN